MELVVAIWHYWMLCSTFSLERACVVHSTSSLPVQNNANWKHVLNLKFSFQFTLALFLLFPGSQWKTRIEPIWRAFFLQKIIMAGGTSCLSLTCSIIGILFATVSVAGIGLSLFLVFGEPYSQINVKGTYTPSWEDIGMYLLPSSFYSTMDTCWSLNNLASKYLIANIFESGPMWAP